MRAKRNLEIKHQHYEGLHKIQEKTTGVKTVQQHCLCLDSTEEETWSRVSFKEPKEIICNEGPWKEQK